MPKRHHVRSPAAVINRGQAQLAELDALITRQRWDMASMQAGMLMKEYPNRPDVLYREYRVAHGIGDLNRTIFALEGLMHHRPNDPDLLRAIFAAYLQAARMASALKALRRLIEVAPAHPEMEKFREMERDMAAELEAAMERSGMSGEDRYEAALLHDETSGLLARNHYAAARRIAEHVIALQPDFMPAYNNISQSYFAEGDIARAAEVARQVVERDPDNVHALSNLTRFYLLLGKPEEARRFAEQLKQSPAEASERGHKIMEAFTYLGDDEAVLSAYRQALESGDDTSTGNPYTHHLAAVAAMRLGREEEARRCWETALKLAPGFDLAIRNLHDLDRPVGERNAPWAYGLSQWLPQPVIEDLVSVAATAERVARHDARGRAVDAAVQRVAERHPELERLVEPLLDRGDPMGRSLAAALAASIDSEATRRAMHGFALSQRGPDALRMQAATASLRAGLLAQPARIWLNGQWEEPELFGFEVTGESLTELPDEVVELVSDAARELRRDHVREAEALLRSAHAIAPDEPSIAHNLFQTLRRSGQDDEAEALYRELRVAHPDYLFGIAEDALRLIRAGNYGEARETLTALLQRPRLRTEEFRCIADVFIELGIASGDRELAQKWLETWEGVDPEAPMLPMVRQSVKENHSLHSALP